MTDLDNRADRLLGAIFRDCRDTSVTFRKDNPLRGQAAELVGELFPGGVQPFTQMTHVDQHAEMERLVEAFNGRFKEQVGALGLRPKVDELAQLTQEYGERLRARGVTKSVTYDDLRAADAEGQDNLLRIIARIIGQFSGKGDEDAAARTALIGPILQQQEEIRTYYRSRRSVRDVDPETGEEEAPPEEPEVTPPPSHPQGSQPTGE